MRVETPAGDVIELGMVGAAPTVGIEDFSRRVTDDFGVTTVVRRGFRRRMSVQLSVATDQVDQLQRQLADLRATPALWIADDRFASLSVRGFYKDFSIDIPGEAISSCTLTIEGLALTDAGVDNGGDPAPDGLASTLRLIQPVTILDATLIDSNVPENDYQEWSAGVTYDAGTRVMRAAAHRVYESGIGDNVGNDPVGASGKWLDVGPTNRWAMFDQALGTATSNPGSVYVLIDITGVDTIALLDLVAGAVRVIADGYDRTVAVDAGAVTFFDLPARGRATVIVGAEGQASVGTLLAGRLVPLGLTEANPSAGITDYSRKVVDDFGAVTIVQRAWAKKMAVRALISTSALDLVATRIAAVRATPALWIGQAGVDALTTYGFFKDYSVEVGENVSKLSLTIEGLSKAAPLLDPNAALNAVRDRLDQLQADVDAIASDGLITAGREKAKLQLDYATLTGQLDAVEARYQTIGQPDDVADARAAAFAARDALLQLLDGYRPAWTDIEVDTPINAGAFRDRWAAASRAISAYAAAITGRPGQDGKDGIDGKDGTDGTDGINGADGRDGADGRTPQFHFAWANSADGRTDFTIGEQEGRTYQGVYVDYDAGNDSGDPARYTWSRYTGQDGKDGADGIDGADGTKIHKAYANSADGHVDFSVTDYEGRRYLGLRIDYQVADSTNPADYGWSLIKGADGTDGADGLDGFVVDVDQPFFAIPVYSSGASKPSWTGGAGTIRLRKGDALVAGGVSYAIEDLRNMAGAGINGSRFSFSGLTADTGSFIVAATFNGATYRAQVDVKKVYDGSAAFRGSVVIQGDGAYPGAVSVGSGTTPIPGGSTVILSATIAYSPPEYGSQSMNFTGRVFLYYRNETDNGPMVFAGQADGSTAYRNNIGTPTEPEFDQQGGEVSASFRFNSAATDKVYYYEARFASIEQSPARTIIGGGMRVEVTG